MGNLIESLIPSDSIKSTSTTNVSTDKESSKSEPSLFDSLLKQNTPTDAAQVVESKSNEIKQIETSPVIKEEIDVGETILPLNVATEKKSLMDLLVERNSKIVTDNNQINVNDNSSQEVISNIYLSSQKNAVNSQMLFNKKEAMALLKESSNVNDIKKSATLLDLGLESISVEQLNGINKDSELLNKIVDRKNILDKILINKNIKDEDLKNIILKSEDATEALVSDKLNYVKDSVVNVNSPLSFNIQSKIIGAKQQMSNMMSEIARQMYENYKPPVTAFKINLNPADLGSIAILMKSDRNSSLSISMSVSNNSTLETLVENQNMLKNSLSKSFDENTKLNLDFTSSNQNNSNNQSSSSSNQNFNSQREQANTQTILQLQEENKTVEEKPLDYM